MFQKGLSNAVYARCGTGEQCLSSVTRSDFGESGSQNPEKFIAIKTKETVE